MCYKPLLQNRKQTASELNDNRRVLYLKGSKANITDTELGWHAPDMQSSQRCKNKTAVLNMQHIFYNQITHDS